MIYVFDHVTDTRDYNMREHRYTNKPIAHGRSLASVLKWMKANNKTDHVLWCNKGEFQGWIGYDYARCLLATGKTFVTIGYYQDWLTQNPR